MKHPLALISALPLTVALLILSACDVTVKQETNNPASSSGPTTTKMEAKVTASQVQGAIDDAAITAQVKAALAADAGLKTLNLDVETQNGTVTITGNVKDQETSTLVIRAAQKVAGVKTVQNRLTVKP